MKTRSRHLLILALALVLSLNTALATVMADPTVPEASQTESTYEAESSEEAVESPSEEESQPSSEEESQPSSEEESHPSSEEATEPSSEDVTEPTPETPAAKNGLIKEGEKYRYYEDGVRVKSAWRSVKVKSKTYKYYFNSNGNAVTGLQKIKKTYYVFQTNCRLYQPSEKKVVTVNDKKYLVSKDGKACKGWNAAKTYYFGPKYVPLTGLRVIKDKFYSFKKSGKLDAEKTKKLTKAAKYEKSMTDLYKLIGQPKKSLYRSGSCYGPGKDGILTYANFYVYTYKEGKKEIFLGADPID